MAAGIVLLVRLVFGIAMLGVILGCAFQFAFTDKWGWVVTGFVAVGALEVIKVFIEKLAGDDATETANGLGNLLFAGGGVVAGATLGGLLGYGMLSWFGLLAGVILGAVIGGAMALEKISAR